MSAIPARYMLDTNTVSYIIHGQPASLRKHLRQVPMASLYISAITEAELLYGVAKKPDARHLPLLVQEFLLRVTILDWDSQAAAVYASLRNACEQEGKPLGTMDLLIAAHALVAETTLVTSDKAFYALGHHLSLEDWTVA